MIRPFTVAALAACLAASVVHAQDARPADAPPATPAAPQAAPKAVLPPMPASTTPTSTSPTLEGLPSDPARDVSQLAWMHGCWSGTVNQRTFTEQWTAPNGGMLLGLGQTVLDGKTESFEFMRIETRADASIAYILRPPKGDEEPFLFDSVKHDKDVDFFVFVNQQPTFPARIIYSHATLGRLFVHVQGKVNGVDREVVYPFAPVNCATGARAS